ncbi:MAG: PRC-barrel domain-containing protein [Pseudomonadota bacterium]|nr:PRC-barrel domain-containing protein [Pseudomonadota bacterium]
MKSFKKAQGMPVATLAEGALVGKFDDFQFDLETGRVYGARLKQGVFSKTGGVPASALVRLGRDLVYVTAEAAIEWTGAARGHAEGRTWASEYKGTKVMSRRGAGLGSVEDFLIALEPPRVTALLLDGGRVVVFDDRVAVGRDTVILSDPAVAVSRPEGDEDSGDWWSRVRGMFESEK